VNTPKNYQKNLKNTDKNYQNFRFGRAALIVFKIKTFITGIDIKHLNSIKKISNKFY